MTYSYDILKSCKPVAGSLASIGIILPEDILSYGQEPHLYPVRNMPTFKDGTRMYIVQPDKNESEFIEDKDTNTVHGDYYNTKVSFNVRRIRNSVDAVRALLINRRVHLLITDFGGKVKFIPNVRLTTDRATTGRTKTARNQYEFTFSSRSTRPAANIPTLSAADNFLGGGGGNFGGGEFGGGGTGGGGVGGNGSDFFRIVPIAELEDGLIVRLRVAQNDGTYAEIGTLLGTLARYIRNVCTGVEDWKSAIGFTNPDNSKYNGWVDNTGTWSIDQCQPPDIAPDNGLEDDINRIGDDATEWVIE